MSNLFPPEVVSAAQSAEKMTGCFACITLSQWAQESGYGKYLSADNNPFGIKWYQGCKYPFRNSSTKEWVLKGTKEDLNEVAMMKGVMPTDADYHEHPETKMLGRYITITAKFISFPTLEIAFDYHGALIVSTNPKSPYHDAQAALKLGWKPFLIAMARVYATDPHYADHLISLIQTNHLDQYNLKK